MARHTCTASGVLARFAIHGRADAPLIESCKLNLADPLADPLAWMSDARTALTVGLVALYSKLLAQN